METRGENVCKICGKHFFAPRKLTLCSEACKRENRLQCQREWKRRHGRVNLMNHIVPGTPRGLDAKAAAAKAAGLTYGQYMAKKRYGAVFPGVM